MRPVTRCLLRIAAWLALVATPAQAQSFHFVVLGDRTGEAQPGVYEEAWKEAAGEHPALIVAVGDTIQGLNDATAAAEWRAVDQILEPYRRIPFYPSPWQSRYLVAGFREALPPIRRARAALQL